MHSIAIERQKLAVAALCGLLFGIGLAISGMTNPNKVLGFLDIAGAWDASLLLVLGSAVAVTFTGFQFVLRRSAPRLDTRFYLPAKTAIDRPLILGSLLFGIGWGISGYCPGPGIALLAAPNKETFIFLPAMLEGWLLFRYLTIMQPTDDAAALTESTKTTFTEAQ